jgi:hypothetical protein
LPVQGFQIGTEGRRSFGCRFFQDAPPAGRPLLSRKSIGQTRLPSSTVAFQAAGAIQPLLLIHLSWPPQLGTAFLSTHRIVAAPPARADVVLGVVEDAPR